MTDPDQSSHSYDITAVTAIRAGLWRVKEEKEILLLLAGLVTIVTLIYYGSAMGESFSMAAALLAGEQIDPSQFEESAELGIGFWLGLPIYLFVYFAPFIIWARVSMQGRDAALEGGFGALFNQILWCVWRYIGMIGWMILLMIGLWVVMMLFGLIVGILFGISSGFDSLTGSGGDDWAGFSVGLLLIIIPLYLGMLYTIFVLMGAWLVSINAEARDVHLPVNKAFKALGSHAWSLGGALMLLEVAAIIIIVILLIPFVLLISGGVGGTVLMIMLGIMSLFGIIFYFLMLSVAGFYAAHLVPGLVE